MLFEKRCREGQVADGRQTFAAYAEYVLRWKRSLGLKHLTELHYPPVPSSGVLPVLGAMRLGDIRPQHLNQLYETLSQPQARVDNVTRGRRPPGCGGRWSSGAGARASPGRTAGRISLTRLRQGKTVRPDTARRIAAALELPPGQLFYPVREEKRLSARTVAELPRPGGGNPEPGGAGNAHPLQPRPPGHAPPKRLLPPPPITSRRRWAGSWRPCRRSP